MRLVNTCYNTGFLQRDAATPNGTPPSQRIVKEVPDRERSKSLQDSYHGLLHRGWTDSCPNIKGSLSPAPSRRIRDSPKPKRSLPCMSTSKQTRLEMQVNFNNLYNIYCGCAQTNFCHYCLDRENNPEVDNYFLLT